MAEIEELRAKVMASMSSKNATSTAGAAAAAAAAVPTPAADPNPKPVRTVSKPPLSCKEDGEISSSSSGDLFGCPPTQSDVEATALHSNIGLRGKQVQNPASGRIPGSMPTVQPLRSTTVQSRMPTKQKYNKKTNPFQYKSGHNSWIAPSGTNDNLVIRFSDDDTDSDSEDPKAGDASERFAETGVTGISCKPSTSSLQFKPSQNTSNSRLQTTGSRGLTNHSSVSTVAKAKESIHKVPGIPVPGKNFWFQKQNLSKKVLPSINQEFAGDFSAEKRLENLNSETDILENKRFPKNINQNKRKTLDIDGATQGPSSKSNSHNATRFDELVSSGKVSLATVDHRLKRQKVSEHSQAKFSLEQRRIPKPVKQQDDVNRRKVTSDICQQDSDVGNQQCNLESSSLLQTDLRSILRQKETVTREGSAIYATSNWRNSTLDSHHHTHDVSCGSDQLGKTMQAISSGLIQDAQLQHLSICAKDATNHQKSSETLEATAGMAHFQSNPFTCMEHEIDIESLMNLEEIKDKELEEAQEERRKCELEERRALKAYRKAQKELISANEKCSLLYRARELFSAQLRAFVMEGSNSLWSSRSLGSIGTAFNSMERRENDIQRFSLGCEVQSKDNMDAVHGQCRTSLRDVRSGTECTGFIDNDSSQLYMLGSDLRSKQYLESDFNVSHPECASDTMNQMNNADESNVVNRSVTSQSAGEEVGEKMVSVDVASEKPPDNAHDYELEANLRSKLFERLRKKATVGAHDLNVKVAGSFEETDGISLDHTKRLSSVIHIQVYEDNGEPVPDDDNIEIPRCSSHGVNSWLPEILSNGKASALDPCAQKEAWDVSMTSFNGVPSAALMGVSSNLKQILLELTSEPDEVSVVPVRSSKDAATEFQTTSNLICSESFVYDDAIDPFWPFCMFELRGKCNNEECPMQHLKACTSWSQAQSNNQILPTSGVRQCRITSLSGPVSMNKSSQISHVKKLFIPSYRIGSIPMKTEVQQAGILLAQSNWLYWQIWFCTSFPLPIAIQRLPLDVPTLQEADSRTDYENKSKRLLANLHSPDDETILHVDVEQCLDVAFYHFNSQLNKPVGRRKALSVLSRALEVNPESSVLWIVYLHMFYGKEKELGKDDMFMHAVQNSRDSYELWLMYINSRMQLQSRMNAYDEALSVLCHKTNLSDMEKQSASACVLDLFLQMINFLCMSGNVETAISRIQDFPNAPNGILPDLLSFLIFTDRCIFWVCCVYLVLYKKLPQIIVHQFEFAKEIPFGIDWPSVELTDTERRQALETMKIALHSVDVNIDSRIDKSESIDNSYSRSLHFLAVTHVEFVMAIEGLEGAASLLDEYINKYPTCIELCLLKSNCQRLLHNGFGFEVFEQALDNWPAGTPGIHCLWNQYASYALDCNQTDAARELIDRWLSCYSGFQDPKLSGDGNEDSSISARFILVSPEAHGYFSSSDDATFKSLNHWLHAVLQRVKDKARQVIDEALKEVSPSLFKHCVREHAAFCHTTAAYSSGICVPMLLGYLRDIRAPSTPQPLSRNFCENIKRPRVQLLISKLLGPVSPDCSILNSILEECYGPSLLPEKFNDPKDLVDCIEALVDVSPANYKLSISALRLVAKSFNCTGAAFYGLMFWASSVLLNSLLQAFPVAPEQAWLEVAGLLSITKIPSICERFHQHALSVYPFSTGLWKSYYRLSKMLGDCSHVIEAARIRGFELIE